jgi:hypothetical protein
MPEKKESSERIALVRDNSLGNGSKVPGVPGIVGPNGEKKSSNSQ